MWARVKGKTENDLLKLPFKAAYMFRPAASSRCTASVEDRVGPGDLCRGRAAIVYLNRVAPKYMTHRSNSAAP